MILAARGTPGDASIERALQAATATVHRYGVVPEGTAPATAGWTARWIDPADGRFALLRDGAMVHSELRTPLGGDHNLQNACAALAVLSHLGVSVDDAAPALAAHGGVRRRQEERGEPGGVLIIDDYGAWEGARKAVDEYFGQRNFKPLLTRVDNTSRVCIKQNN